MLLECNRTLRVTGDSVVSWVQWVNLLVVTWCSGVIFSSRSLSKFEVLTGMAFAGFADASVDAAVIEVGLGGPAIAGAADAARPRG